MTDFNRLFPLPKNLYSVGYTPIIVQGNPNLGIESGTYKITPTDLQGQACKVVAVVAGSAPVSVLGTPPMPAGISALRITGSVTAVDVVSGDAISWDIAALVSRSAITGLPTLIGDTSVAVFQAGPTMGAVPLPTITVVEYGISVNVAGIAGRQFAVTGSLVFA